MCSKMSSKYSKDSFDRFGDDLCQLVLSFLPFEDCFRFECLSKQWKRLVFDKRFQLNLKDIQFISLSHYLQTIETILKKCPNIESIDFGRQTIRGSDYDIIFSMIKDIIGLIEKHCHNLSEVKCHSKHFSEEFYIRNGQKLKSIKLLVNNINENKAILKLCPNLTSLDIESLSGLSIVLTLDKILLKGLTEIKFKYIGSDAKDRTFEQLVENNTKLKSISVIITDKLSETQMNQLFNGFNGLSKLTSLQIILKTYFKHSFKHSFISCLSNIAENCPKIKTLVLEINDWWPESIDHFVPTLILFKRLKCLRFSHGHLSNRSSLMRSQALQHFKQLTHLEINDCYLSEEFFDDIDRHLPQLKCIDISVNVLSKKTLKGLAKLRDIESIRLYVKTTCSFNAKDVFEVTLSCLNLHHFHVCYNYSHILYSVLSLKPNEIHRLRQLGVKGSGFMIEVTRMTSN